MAFHCLKIVSLVMSLRNRKTIIIMSLYVRKPTICVPTRSDTNRPVQSQKIARCFKFRMKEEEGLYYPCSENKGDDQLRDYREADLRLCFRIYANCWFTHTILWYTLIVIILE